MTERLVSVAVPVPHLDLLTYRVPDHLPGPAPGARVRVPLGPRQLVGLVVLCGDDARPAGAGAPEPGGLRDIAAILDERPLLPPDVVTLCLWMADYYLCGPGDALAAAMPPGAWRRDTPVRRTVRVVRLAGLAVPAGLTPDGTPPDAAARRLGTQQLHALSVLRGHAAGLSLPALRNRGVSAATIERLSRRGLVTIDRERVRPDPLDQHLLPAEPQDGPGIEAERQLTGEQATALARLEALAGRPRFATVVLHGVTGSGKTEIYLRLARKVLEGGRGVLVMVPEIALTPALATAFRDTFGDRLAVQHSGLGGSDRYEQWQRIRDGDVDVVVGTRSAVFAPLPSLGLVIIDEEHDGSYKQEENPRYNGRDVAIMRASRAGALVVAGSATPSLESYHHAATGRYELLRLERRVLDRPLTSVRIVNMRDEYAEVGPDVALSRALAGAVADRLARREQVLVLLNRRGFATVVFCRQCTSPLDCPNCSVSLTVHEGPRGRRRARCHYCGYSMVVPAACPRCASPYMEQAGFGTERIVTELERLFPEARVARLDRDAVRQRGAPARLLGRFARGEIDVLVGTQMIAKGHDFPRVTLVGVVSADIGLGLADFRAAERTFQLLTQVVGRAGRGDRPGEAIIQTLYPEHYGIRLACAQDYGAFFVEEMRYRRAMRYPPAVGMINGIVRGASLSSALADAGKLVALLQQAAAAAGTFTVLGPAPAPLAKLRGEHRAQFFLKGTRRQAMREAVRAALAAEPALRRRVTIDVDPVTVL